MFKAIDRFIDNVTMYRLLIYYLAVLLIAATILSSFGVLHYQAAAIAMSTVILIIACVLTNKAIAAIFRAPTNVESAYITALILALIVSPATIHSLPSLTFLLAVSGLSMASKYILAISRKHLFNPAAIAVVLTALGPRQSASWWVGTASLLPLVIIGGILILRKIHRTRMFLSFLAATTVSTTFYAVISKVSVASSLHDMVFSSAVFFLGFVMLTEPLTSPPTVGKQAWYGALVGFLLPPQVHLFSLYSSPEIALVIGNIFSYIVSPKTKLFPVLKQKLLVAADSIDFIFLVSRPQFSYQPGQYMEWTLPHKHGDSRGNRRYFTLASSPTETDVRIGVKFNQNGSSFKRSLRAMTEDSLIAVDHLAGDFVMPTDKNQKLVFIAGGIGITPFRSMIKYLIDTNERRDIVLLYTVKTAVDLAYTKIFEEARVKLGLKVVYCLTASLPNNESSLIHCGRIDRQLIASVIPDYAQRKFYLSGPTSLVNGLKHDLQTMGVHRSRIKHDDFSGYN